MRASLIAITLLLSSFSTRLLAQNSNIPGGNSICTVTNSASSGLVITAGAISGQCNWASAPAGTVDANAIKNGNYIADTSVSANTITGTTTTTYPGAYAAGQQVVVKVANSNTGATTININSLGAKNVTKFGANALVTGDLTAGQTYHLTYDGTQFQVNDPNLTATNLAALSGGGSTNFLRADGTWAATNAITALTGDVTASGPGSVAATIASGAVTFAKMANLAANSFICNNTNVSATAIACSQAQSTALLNQFTSSLQGVVPASGGGTVNFLRADGTWQPAGTGSGTVTVVSSGTLTSTACVTGGGSQQVQTPSPNCTVDTNGNQTANSFVGGNTADSAMLIMNGKTSGTVALAVPDIAGTAITYMLPSTNGTSGQVLEDSGSATCGTYQAGGPATCHQLAWTAAGSGTVTSVGFTGGIVSVATATTTPAFTVAGTSGGIVCFTSSAAWASSTALTANALVVGGGSGACPTVGNADFTYATHTLTGGASGLLDLSAITGTNGLKIPVQASSSCTANGCEFMDSGASNYHNFATGHDSLVMTMLASGSYTNAHCANIVVSSTTVSLGDFGAACGGAAAFPVNAQTTTYSVVSGDFAACKTIQVSSGTFTITLLAVAPTNGQCIWVNNYGSGVVTVARNGLTINGAAANLTLAAGSASSPSTVFIVSNGTNYFASVIGTGSAAGVSALTGDGALITNSASSGSVTLALGTAGAHKYWGNNTGSTTTPSYSALVAGDLPYTSCGMAGVVNKAVTYNIVSGDAGTLFTMNGSSLSANLPSTAPTAPWCVVITNLNASALTVGRNSLTINGGTSNITLQQYQWTECFSDSSNYFCNTPIVAGTGITLTPASNGLSLASTGGSNAGIVPQGGPFYSTSVFPKSYVNGITASGDTQIYAGPASGNQALVTQCTIMNNSTNTSDSYVINYKPSGGSNIPVTISQTAVANTSQNPSIGIIMSTGDVLNLTKTGTSGATFIVGCDIVEYTIPASGPVMKMYMKSTSWTANNTSANVIGTVPVAKTWRILDSNTSPGLSITTNNALSYLNSSGSTNTSFNVWVLTAGSANFPVSTAASVATNTLGTSNRFLADLAAGDAITVNTTTASNTQVAWILVEEQ